MEYLPTDAARTALPQQFQPLARRLLLDGICGVGRVQQDIGVREESIISAHWLLPGSAGWRHQFQGWRRSFSIGERRADTRWSAASGLPACVPRAWTHLRQSAPCFVHKLLIRDGGLV